MDNMSGCEPFLRDFFPFYGDLLARARSLKITAPGSAAYETRRKETIRQPALDIGYSTYAITDELDCPPDLVDRGSYVPALDLEEELNKETLSLSGRHGISSRLLFRPINRLESNGHAGRLPLYFLFLSGMELTGGPENQQGIYCHLGYSNPLFVYDPDNGLAGDISLRFNPQPFMPSDPDIRKKIRIEKNYAGAIHQDGLRKAMIIYNTAFGRPLGVGEGKFFYRASLLQNFFVTSPDQGRYMLDSDLEFRTKDPSGSLTALLDLLQPGIPGPKR